MEREETARLHVVDARPVRLLAVHLVRHAVQRAVRPHGVEMARHQHRLALAWRARDQVVAEAVAAGDAGERGTRPRQFALGHVHQPVDRGGVRGGGFHRHPGGEFGQQVLGASHVGLRHWLVLALRRLTGGGCVHRTGGVVHGSGRGRESAAPGYCL